jgi:hypothetical protein
MDKEYFVDVAPEYYALAIACYFQAQWSYPASKQEILDYYTIEESNSDSYCYVSHSILFEKGTRILVERGLISEIPDDFGPPIYVRHERFDERLDKLRKVEGSLFFKYGLSREGQSWVRSALRALNETYDQLGIRKEDFTKPDEEWEPLPIDREDQHVKRVIDSLDQTIEQVRADNGYAAKLPEEREYVLERLSSVSKKLKETATVSVAYIQKNALEPLGRLIWRFKQAAIGVTAGATYAAIFDWLKANGIKLLDYIFKGG